MRHCTFILSGLLSLALAATPCPGHATPLPSVWLEELTSPEVRDAVAAGVTTIIIPVGGTEQNGAHMALGKHNARVKALAGQVAAALGNALVAPVIAYVPEGAIDPPTGHMRYAGTISVPAATYRAVLTAAALSFRQHGFRDIVLLGDSGDYQKDNAAVAAALNQAWRAGPARAHAINDYYDAATRGFAAQLAARGHAPAAVGTHAGLADTALTLATAPELVRSKRMGEPASAGVTGDPRQATAALGKLAVDSIVERTVAAIRHATAPR